MKEEATERKKRVVTRLLASSGLHIQPDAIRLILECGEDVERLARELAEHFKHAVVISAEDVSNFIRKRKSDHNSGIGGDESRREDVRGDRCEGDEGRIEKMMQTATPVVLRSFVEVHPQKDFLQIFRDRYERLSRILRKHVRGTLPIRSLKNVATDSRRNSRGGGGGGVSGRSGLDEEVSVIGIVSSMRRTARGNTVVEIEDMTGELSVILRKEDAEDIVEDEVICVSGRLLESGYLLANLVIRPDVPLSRRKNASWRNDSFSHSLFHSLSNSSPNSNSLRNSDYRSHSSHRSHSGDGDDSVEDIGYSIGDTSAKERSDESTDESIERKDESKDNAFPAAIFISDIHAGSKTFMEDAWCDFIDWVRENAAAKNIAYLVVAGDIVDGIGVYPEQEKELELRDVEEQYALVASYLKRLPSFIHIVLSPGNHDAVRNAEPQPPLPPHIQKMFPKNTIFVSNPAYVELAGRIVLIYHGQSYDDFISAIPRLRYEKPEEVMVEMLKRRHVAPIYGKNVALFPAMHDYGVIEPIPDIMHCGHVHTVGISSYRHVLLINSGTWQSQTSYQRKRGISPVPCHATLVNLAEMRVQVHKFA